jgi:hypothetical protein
MIAENKTNAWDKWIERLLVPLSAIGLTLCLLFGIGRSIWLDDANSLLLAHETFQGLIDRLRDDNNLPVYYILLRGWIAVFGDSETASRLLSGLFYVAAVGAVFSAARLLTSSVRAGLYCAFFYAISSQAIHQTQAIRAYSLLGFESALSILLFLRMARRKEARTLECALWAIVNAVGCFTHIWFFFLVGAETMASVLVVSRKRLPSVFLWCALSFVPFLLWLPILWVQFHSEATDWLPALPWLSVADVFFRFYGGAASEIFGSLFFFLGCLILLNRTGYKRFSEWCLDSYVRFLGLCFLLSLAVPLAVSAIKPIYFADRYSIIALPALSLLLGMALSRFAPRLPLALFCSFLVVSEAFSAISTRTDGSGRDRMSDRSTAEFIIETIPKGDVLAFTSLDRLSVDYYLRRGGCGECYRENTFPAEIEKHPGWRSIRTDEVRLESLRAEARDTVSGWQSSGAESVWLFYGWDVPISQIVKQELEDRFVFQQEIQLKGTFHNSILRYRIARKHD